MTDNRDSSSIFRKKFSRRSTLKGLGATAAGLVAGPGFVRYAQAQSSAPIKIGFQAHRTGIGAAYGRWYEKTTNAAIKAINAAGGINGRQVEVIVEDDGTDPGPRRGNRRQVRHPAQGGRRLRHAVQPRRHRLGAASRAN